MQGAASENVEQNENTEAERFVEKTEKLNDKKPSLPVSY